jgi:aminoglycoside 3-N-acetyltransferase
LSKKNIKNKLNTLFKNLNIKKGDKLIVHSNIAGILQYYKTDKITIAKVFFSFLREYLGKNGIIIIPTYNYEFTKNKFFNTKNSNSEVGFFSDYFLNKNWIKRTLDPVFSHLIFGKIKNFDKNKINKEAFGKESIFASLKNNNFKVLCFCCSSNQITYLHYVEYIFKVPYRFIKKFQGLLQHKKIKQKITYKYNVGKKKYDYSLKEKKINQLIDEKNFIKSKFGKFECYSADCKYLYINIGKKIKKTSNYLIK